MRRIGCGVFFWTLCFVATAAEPGGPTQNCCLGEKLRLALRAENAAPFYMFDTPTIPLGEEIESDLLRGFVPDFLAKVAVATGVDLDYYPLDRMLPPEELNSLVEDLLANGTVDGYLSFGLDASNFGSNQLGGKFAYSLPFFTSPVGGVVKRTLSPPNFSVFLQPFEYGLWYWSIVTMIIVALCLVLIQVLEDARAGESTRAWLERVAAEKMNFQYFFDAFYNSTSVFLAGDNYDWPTSPERVLRIGWLFFSLVVVATYTANLAAFFTTDKSVLHSPPTGMGDLHLATACTVMLDAQEGTAMLDQYVKSVITPPPECQFWDACGKQYCYDAIQNGQADVWLDDGLALHQYIQENSFCTSLARIPEIRFLPFVNDVFVMMDHSEWAFVGNLSAAIAFENNEPDYLRLLNKHFMAHSNCASSFSHTKVSYAEMRGLFMTCLMITAFAVLHAFARAFMRHRAGSMGEKGSSDVTSRPRDAELSDRISKLHSLLSDRLPSSSKGSPVKRRDMRSLSLQAGAA